MRTSARFRVYREARSRLCEAYPAAFPRSGRRPPLKVGIARDVIADPSHGLSGRRVRVFLSIWTRSTAYLEGIARGTERVGPDGSPCGRVDPAHALEARRILEARRARRRV